MHYGGNSMVEQASSRAPTGPAARSRLYEVDLLRFAAALAVVLFHYAFDAFQNGDSSLDFSGTIGPVAKYGYLGVDLFFLISGFVVFMSAWGRPASRFLISRVTRLYPAYWVLLTATALIVAAGWVPEQSVKVGQYLVNLTMFQPLANVPHVEGAYWTLWAEWRFYALLFLLALVGITTGRALAFMWTWLGASVALALLPLPSVLEQAAALIVQPLYSHYFIAGMALFLVHRDGWTKQFVVLLGLSWALGVYQVIELGDVKEAELATQLDPVVLPAIVTAMFLLMTGIATGRLARFGRPYFTHLGRLTYPLYLGHATAGIALFHWLAPVADKWLLLIAVTAVMCGVAWLVARYVEEPLQPIMRTRLGGLWETSRARVRRQVG